MVFTSSCPGMLHGNPLTGKADPGDKPNLDLAERALSGMVSRYRNAPWVLYSLINEPAYITWAEFRPVAETDRCGAFDQPECHRLCLRESTGPHDLSGVLQTVRRPNVVYEVHAYPGNRNLNRTRWQDAIVPLAARYPVFIGEWG